MTHAIEREITRFEAFPALLAAAGFGVEAMAEFSFVVRPKGSAVALPRGKDIALSLMGITHGNEWAGIAAVNEILSLVAARAVDLSIPTAFLLGNPWAARVNKRFLERDLNRCFARASASVHEEKRANVLGQALSRTAYLVDFHQTSRRSERPFFIFPFQRQSYEFARQIAPRQSIITHWGKPFSAEGMCSDEFVNAQGGVGVSLELGQNGFDPYQIAVGTQAGLWAIRAVATNLGGDPTPAARLVESERAAESGELFTWAEIMPWPDGEHVELVPHLYNFQQIAAGENLGTVDGKPLLARTAGRMLFPKYLSREEQKALESRPTELCRLLRPIGEGDLPK